MTMRLLIAGNRESAHKELKRLSAPTQEAVSSREAEDMSFTLSDPWFAYKPPAIPPDILEQMMHNQFAGPGQ